MADPTVRPISAADITTWDYEPTSSSRDTASPASPLRSKQRVPAPRCSSWSGRAVGAEPRHWLVDSSTWAVERRCRRRAGSRTRSRT